VLYVEDNTWNAQLVERVIALVPNVELRVAADGATAIERARDEPPDLLLLDLHLPDMPGEQVLEALRREPATAATSVVVVSADPPDQSSDRLRALGVDQQLTKPFEIDELLRIVRRASTGATVPRDRATRVVVDPRIIDPDVIAGLVELDDLGGGSPLASLVALFLETARERVLELRDAIERRDAARVESITHSLRGSAGNFGAREVAARSQEIRTIAAEQAFAGAAEALDRLVEALGDAEEQLSTQFGLAT
jgi:CheY-like chemotaxis protein/HPt (histidine-containing phosphotransfer) domain-containing protein